MDATEFARRLDAADTPKKVQDLIDEATDLHGHQGTARLIRESAPLITPAEDKTKKTGTK